jgi:acyl carrier protein
MLWLVSVPDLKLFCPLDIRSDVFLVLSRKTILMPDHQTTATRIAEYLTEALCYPGQVEPNTDLLEAGLVDSLMIMDLVEHLQVTYGLHITAADLKPQNFRSAAAMSQLVARKQNASGHLSVS